MPGVKKQSSEKSRKGRMQGVRQPATTAVSRKNRRKQRQRLEERPADSYAYGTRTISRTSAQGLSITVQIPPLRRPKSDADKRPASKPRIFRPAVLVPLVAVIVGGVLTGINLKPHAAVHVAAVSAAKRTEPDYRPLVPSDSQASQTGYNGDKNLVSFTTTFNDARITVSEQPLPANFAADGSALKRAADSISAFQKIDTVNGPLYVTVTDKDNGQMGVYAGKGVLVFVHADKNINDVSWKSFIELLKSKDWQSVRT